MLLLQVLCDLLFHWESVDWKLPSRSRRLRCASVWSCEYPKGRELSHWKQESSEESSSATYKLSIIALIFTVRLLRRSGHPLSLLVMKNMIDPFKPGWHSAVITVHLQVIQENPLVPPGCPQPFHPGGSLSLTWSCLLLSHSYLWITSQSTST